MPGEQAVEKGKEKHSERHKKRDMAEDTHPTLLAHTIYKLVFNVSITCQTIHPHSIFWGCSEPGRLRTSHIPIPLAGMNLPFFIAVSVATILDQKECGTLDPFWRATPV